MHQAWDLHAPGVADVAPELIVRLRDRLRRHLALPSEAGGAPHEPESCLGAGDARHLVGLSIEGGHVADRQLLVDRSIVCYFAGQGLEVVRVDRAAILDHLVEKIVCQPHEANHIAGLERIGG